jgi:broad specificity phosphatase PhoE
VPGTRILLARHAETDWNRIGRWQGHADQPLNETGREQAAELGRRLKGRDVVAVYSSDLRRARDTATIVGAELGIEVVQDPELREIDVGSWSGLTRSEVAERFPEGYTRWQAGEIGHDGETREQLAARVIPAVERIAHAHPGDTVLVVTHGGVIRTLLRHAAGDPGAVLENTATVTLTLIEGSIVLDGG